jgi:hypothetical protein
MAKTIAQLKKEWEQAKTKEERDRIHAEADKLRGFRTETTVSGGKYYQTPTRMEGTLTSKAVQKLPEPVIVKKEKKPLIPATFRNATNETKITPEQQARNQEIAIQELKGPQGNLASFVRGAAGAMIDPFGIRNLKPEWRNNEQDKASSQNTFDTQFIKNPRAVSQGIKPVEVVKSKAKYETLGEFAGSMVGVDPIAIAGTKGIEYAINKVAKKARVPETAAKAVINEMNDLEKMAYESNIRKGKIKPDNDTIYGNSFKTTAGALPEPKITTERKAVSPEEAFLQWRKENFGGAYGKVSKEDMQALRELYAETTQPNYQAAAGTREIPRTITQNELPKTKQKIPESPYPLNQPVLTKEGKPGKVVAHVPESNGLNEAYIVKPDGAKRKEMKVYKPEEIKPLESPKVQSKKTGEEDLPRKGTKPNNEMNILDRAYQQTVDNQLAISKATKGINSKADKDPVILASNARNAKGTAEYAIKNGLTDMEGRKITDYSLEQILLRPKSEQQAYEDYLLHKHNIARYQKDKPVFGEEVTDAVSRQKVAEYESQYPQFKGLSETLNDYNGKVIDNWLIKSGLISEDLGKILKKMYPDYVPTIREGGVPGKQYKTKGLKPGEVVKQAVGGNKPIMELTKSYPIMVEKAIKSARKNEVYLGLLDTIEKNPEKMARWAKIADDTAETKYKDAITVTDANEIIQKNGLDGIEEVSNKQLEIDNRNGKYYVTAMKNGKPVRMEVNKDLFDALESLNRTGNEGTLDGMAAAVRKYATNPFKALITGYNPVFAIKNIFRDIPTSYIQGTENNPLKWGANLVRAGTSMAKNDELFQEFVALGGKKSGFFDVDKGLKSESLPTRAIRKGAEKIGAFNQFTETLPRYGEYIGTVRREGGDYAAKQKGLYNAGEVTVNFARQGDKVKAADAVVPYLNPAVQGIDKAIRNLKNPATYAKGAAVITTPTAALYMINQAVDKEAYDQLDNRTKDTNFLIPIGNGQFIKIPKSRESGVIFGSLFERLFRLAEGQDNAFKGFGTTVATNFAPSNPIENNILAPITLNLAKNEDFANRKIVPMAMQEDNRSPYLQYDEQTSEIAKWFGNQARMIPGLEEGMSPKQIDYVIKSYTGIVGQILQPATTKGGNPFENVIKRGFTADNVFNNEIQNQFYEAYDNAKRLKTDMNINQDIPSDYVTPEEKRISVYSEASKQMSELRKKEKQVTANMKNGPAKEKTLRDIRQEILNIAQKTPGEAERVYNEYKASYIPELSMMSQKQVDAYKDNLLVKGITPQQYRKAYISQKDYSTNVRKAIALQLSNNTNMYDAFEIKDNYVAMADAIRQSGLINAYDYTYAELKGVTGSEEKKAIIDRNNPNLDRYQLSLLYEAFDVSQGIGGYSRQFKDESSKKPEEAPIAVAYDHYLD